MNLYEVTEQLAQLEAEIESNEGELSEEMLAKYLALQDDFEEAVLSGAAWLKNKSAEEEVIKDEIARLQARKSSIINRTRRFKEFMANVALQKGMSKFKNELFTVSVRQSPSSVNISDEAQIPKDMLIPQPPTVDKKALKAYIEEGNTVVGVSLTTKPMMTIR